LCVAFYTLHSALSASKVKTKMIKIFKQAEEVHDEYRDVEIKKTEAVAYWQKNMRIRIA